MGYNPMYCILRLKVSMHIGFIAFGAPAVQNGNDRPLCVQYTAC